MTTKRQSKNGRLNKVLVAFRMPPATIRLVKKISTTSGRTQTRVVQDAICAFASSNPYSK